MVFRNLGAALLLQNQVEKAIWRIEQGLAAFPNSLGLLQNLAIALEMVGDIAGALEKLERGLILEPENQIFNLLKTRFLLLLDREKEALAFARQKLVPPDTPDEAILSYFAEE
jgi:tetratricopeptide (TPR) repeat protein